MNERKRVNPTPLKTKAELARHLGTLLKVSPNLDTVFVEVPYQGQTFTVAKATLTLPSGKQLVGEGVSRKSFIDDVDPNCGFNVAVKRSLESLDKQLRRVTHLVGHRFEG